MRDGEIQAHSQFLLDPVSDFHDKLLVRLLIN